MRVICVLWLAMLVSALGTPGDPGEAALRFLEKARARQLNLEPGGDTALSPLTSKAKRQHIARRLERLAGDLGDDPLEVGPVKQDGGVAGVLIHKSGGFEAASQRVFAIALVKHGDAWMAAPLPASFENTGLGYSDEVRQSAAALQDWLLRQQVLFLEKLRDQSADRLRLSIEESLPAKTLRSFDSRQAGMRFLDACAARNLPEMLGLLGGIAANPPEDWAQRVKSATTAARSPDVNPPWRLLISNNILRVPVHHEEDDGQALLSIACLDPAGNGANSTEPRIAVVHLELAKSDDGFWRVNPPPQFFRKTTEDEQPEDELLDADLLDAFPEKLAGIYQPAPLSTAQQLSESLLDRLHNGGLPDVARLIQPAGNSRESCLRAARMWQLMHEPGGFRRLIPLGFKEDARTAAAICHLFSARSPDRLDLRVFHFEKTAAGWLWTPQAPKESDSAPHDWTDDVSGEWQDRLLDSCVELEDPPESGAPSEADARAVVESWLKATAAGDVSAALRLTARLKNPDSKATVLRNLGYEMSGSRKNDEPPAVTGVHRGGIWTAVGVRRAADDGKPAHPFYPIVNTPAGSRILIEIDLFASKNRSRDFLNRTSLDRLRHLAPGFATELKELFSKHQSANTEAAAP